MVLALLTVPAIEFQLPKEITLVLIASVLTYLVLLILKKEPDLPELLNLIGECTVVYEVDNYRCKMLERGREFFRKKDALNKILTLDFQDMPMKEIDDAFSMAERIMQSKAGRFYKRLLIIKSKSKVSDEDKEYLYKIVKDVQRLLGELDSFLIAVSEMKQDHSLDENKIVDFTNSLIILNQEELRYE